jgi:hypothetical protein
VTVAANVDMNVVVVGMDVDVVRRAWWSEGAADVVDGW